MQQLVPQAEAVLAAGRFLGAALQMALQCEQGLHFASDLWRGTLDAHSLLQESSQLLNQAASQLLVGVTHTLDHCCSKQAAMRLYVTKPTLTVVLSIEGQPVPDIRAWWQLEQLAG